MDGSEKFGDSAMTPILYGAKHGRFPAPPLDWAACGKPANYRAHLRRGEKPCGPCRKAEGVRTAERRRAIMAAGGNPVKVAEKVCGGCREVKPASGFWRDRVNSDGLRSRCKRCTKSGWGKKS
jgi:hypothetical protein